MSQQLAYVIITPYSLHKSRTGGILSRLITRTGLELAGARMFGPSAQLVKDYAEATISGEDPQEPWIQKLIYEYIQENIAPDPKTDRRRRVMMLLFKGEDAVRKTRAGLPIKEAQRHSENMPERIDNQFRLDMAGDSRSVITRSEIAVIGRHGDRKQQGYR